MRKPVSLPKPMMPIGSRPVLWHVMRYYAHFGHTEFVLCLGYGDHHVKNYFLDYRETESNDFVLRDGTRIARSTLFFNTGRHQRSPLAERLGCRFDEGAVATDRPLEETSVPGVFVAGDASKDLLLVVVAAAEGAKAAFAINRALCREEGRH